MFCYVKTVVSGHARRKFNRILRRLHLTQFKLCSFWVVLYLQAILTISLQIRGMGMNSPELLLLVENCPKGAETLVTRCLHILTDKGKKQSETVEHVTFHLYNIEQ